MATMKKLDLFWRHSNCGIATKIHVAEAVLRAKLLYGLESAQLIPSVLKQGRKWREGWYILVDRMLEVLGWPQSHQKGGICPDFQPTNILVHTTQHPGH